MNMDKLKAAHDAELEEAGLKPGILIQQENLQAAFNQYLMLKDSSSFYSGTARLLKDGAAEREAQERIATAATKAEQRVIGAKAILKALGFDVDKYETEGSGKHEHS
jgi:hypothetical protein